MKVLITYCCLWLLSLQFAWAGPGDGFRPTDVGAYSIHFAGIFSLAHNQAALARTTHFMAGIDARRRFMLREASSFHFGAALPVASGAFAITGSWFGYEVFNRQKLGLAYGLSLGKHVDIGMQMDYLAAHIQQYGDAHTLTGEVGAVIHFNDHWHLGLHAFNPAQVRFPGDFEGDVPSIYTMGAGFEPSDKVVLGMEGNWDTVEGAYGCIAFQYRLVPAFALMAGFSTEADQDFLGIQLLINDLRIDISAEYHPSLGLTPGMGLVYTLNK